MIPSPFRFALALTSLPLLSFGEIIGVDTFDYLDGSIANQSGGSFWDYANNTGSPTHTGTASDWDNESGAPLISNGRLVTNNSGASREYNGPGEGVPPSEEGDGAVNPVTAAKAVYYRVTATTGDTVPDYFGFSSHDFSPERLFFGKTDSGPNFRVRVFGTGDGISSFPAAANTTYTFVAKLDFANDVIAFFVNPDLNQTEPAADTSIAYTGTHWSTAVRLASGPGGEITWDNLVVATTWDDLGTIVTTTTDEDDSSLDPSLGTGVSLREAVNHSPSGTLVTFASALNGQVLPITSGELNPNGKLTLDARSLSQGITLDGEHHNQLFRIDTGDSLRAEALTFSRGNASGTLGGAIRVNNGELFLTDCTLTDHIAEFGGAIYSNTDLSGPTTTLNRCTLSGNHATNAGGAIRNGAGLTILSYCTITANTAPYGGGVASYGDTATLTQSAFSIISGNSGGDTVFTNGTTNSFSSQGFNLIGDGNTTGAFTISGDQVGITDPKLAPLAPYGGPTMTCHPLVGSPAIDAAGTVSPSSTDQRGYPRFTDGDGNGTAQLDIGAVESGPGGNAPGGPFLEVTTTTDELDGIAGPSTGAGVSLREAIHFAPEGAVVSFQSGVGIEDFPTTLALGEIVIDKNLFIDASNLDAPVTLSGNHANRIFNVGDSAEVAMTHLAITEGHSADGLDWDDPSNPNSPFDATHGAPGGGILNAGHLSLIHCQVHGNETGMGGDGFFNSEDPESSVSGGDSGTGGGIHNQGRLFLESSTLSGNRTGAPAVQAGSASGGAIYSTPETMLIIRRCSLIDNLSDRGSSGGDGGAVYLYAASLRAHDSTISGNHGFSGGAIRCTSSSEILLSRCTLAGNSAKSGGGAIEMNPGTQLLLDHCTISANFAGNSGGGAIYNGGSTAANHSILAGNTPNNITKNPITGTGNLIDTDPQLSPLGDYGGPTLTMLPLPGSPALDTSTGSTATTDQRGFPRPIGPANDIGATEAPNWSALTPDYHALLWPIDLDGDGSPYGIEVATGTNPFTPNATSSLAPPQFSSGIPSLTFGNNPSTPSGTILRLMRSTTLADGSFTEVARITNGSSPTDAEGGNIFILSGGTSPAFFSDTAAPTPKAFYRLESDYMTPTPP